MTGWFESSVWAGLAAIGFLSRWIHPDGSGMQKCRKLYMRFSVLAASDGGSALNRKKAEQKRLDRKGEPYEGPPLKRYEALPYGEHASYP